MAFKRIIRSCAPEIQMGEVFGGVRRSAWLGASLGMLVACSAAEPAEQDASAQSTPATSLGSESGSGSGDDSNPQHSEQSEDDPPSSDDELSDEDPTGTDPDASVKFDLGPLPDAVENNGNTGLCKIDFLFVLDNSPTMSAEQDNLARSVPQFIEVLRKNLEIEDFHVGVVTTDDYSFNSPGCRNKLGALIRETGGNESSDRVCGPYASGGGFMTPADDLDDKFGCAARPGVLGSPWELPLAATHAALSGPNVAPGGCNEGFLREDALLVITIITDEDDDGDKLGNQETAEHWYQQVFNVKGREESLVVLSLIGRPRPNACVSDNAELGVKIQRFTESFGERGLIGDVCEESYGAFFKQAVDVIDFACDELDPEG